MTVVFARAILYLRKLRRESNVDPRGQDPNTCSRLALVKRLVLSSILPSCQQIKSPKLVSRYTC